MDDTSGTNFDPFAGACGTVSLFQLLNAQMVVPSGFLGGGLGNARGHLYSAGPVDRGLGGNVAGGHLYSAGPDDRGVGGHYARGHSYSAGPVDRGLGGNVAGGHLYSAGPENAWGVPNNSVGNRGSSFSLDTFSCDDVTMMSRRTRGRKRNIVQEVVYDIPCSESTFPVNSCYDLLSTQGKNLCS
jgi:hypothetical protein